MKQVKKRNINGRSVPASNKSYKTGLSWWIVLCLFFAIIAYLPVFRAGFVDWDDGDYASGSSALRIFSDFWALLKKPVQGNYHPLTMLSLSFNFHVFGKSPFSFHVLNLLIHLVNIFLVYWFFKKLLNGKELPGIIAALFFGIHPLHVESVAWISERKDVLYTAFFLLSMITYLRYLKSNKFKDFLFVFFFFIVPLRRFF